MHMTFACRFVTSMRPIETAVLLAALSVIGCGQRSLPEARARRVASGGDVVVAAVWPWRSRSEVRFGDGLELATAEVNASGGIGGRRLRIQRYDDGESLDEGAILAQRIGSDTEVAAVIGHLQSYVTASAAPIYELSGLLLLAPTATDPGLTTRGYHRVFQATFTDRDTGRQLADYARARYQRIAICYVRNNYGRNLANAFEERATEIGLSIVARRSYDAGEQLSRRSFESMVRDWKGLELDAIFLAGEVPSAGLFVAQARAEGLDVPILGGDAMSSPSLLTSAGAAGEGMVVVSFFHPDEPRPEVQTFKAEFQRRFGVVPDAGAALAYDAVQLLARAMRHARSAVPDQTARALRELPPWAGVTGKITFDKAGAAVGKRSVMSLVRGGRFVYLEEVATLSRTERDP
jgi:branched-chain amino acid transport system substrate-binding protein